MTFYFVDTRKKYENPGETNSKALHKTEGTI
jgi:hypothetical protein